MHYDRELVNHKLIRWKGYLSKHALPTWEEIPAIGLYMDQVVGLLGMYLDYLPRDEGAEPVVTAHAINNYVRMKIMPPPPKKKYERIHIAYLIMICTLKQSMSISYIHKLLPEELTEEEMKQVYTDYVRNYSDTTAYFLEQVEKQYNSINTEETPSDYVASQMIYTSSIMANLSKLLARKLQDIGDLSYEEAVSLEESEQ